MSIPEDPHTRIERYLDVLAGGDGTIPAKPHTRIERYLDVLAGGDGTKPAEPHTRIERYLDAIVDGTYKREESSDPYNTLVIPDNSSDELILKSLIGATVAWNQLAPAGGGTVVIPAGHVYYFGQTEYIEKVTEDTEVVCDSDSVLVDLTTMYGATVADYLAQHDMGAWVTSYIENLDKSYNAGTLVSVAATAHVIKDIEGVVQHTYPLDSSLELRGLVKLDASRVYYDGDTYEAGGTVTRRYGIVDAGTLAYTLEDNETHIFRAAINDRKGSGLFICDKYYNIGGVRQDITRDMECANRNNSGSKHIDFRNDSVSTAAQMRTAMSGIYIVYELETPTTGTATPFTNLQTVEPGGTASFVGNDIPVGADVILSVKS